MQCPHCGFEKKKGAVECLKCGIVFAKYDSERHHPDHETPVSSLTSQSKEDDSTTEFGSFLKDLLFSVKPETNIVSLIGRILVLLVMIIWGIKFIFSSIMSNYSGSSFMHLVNLPFHEAGHVLFRIFGQFMMTLGGSLTQLLVPLVCLAAFLLKTRDPFAASVSLWWLGQSLIDLSPYINDARRLQLILLGGVTGRDVADYHDWQFILRKLGLLNYDHVLAKTAHISGAFFIICALVWGGYMLFKQYRSVRAEE
ncbi:MAG: zinc ribbon domain-containing protein [Nitrospirota bacterium]